MSDSDNVPLGPDTTSPSADVARDRLLADLLQVLSAAPAATWHDTLVKLQENHPDVAAELAQLAGTAQLAAAVGSHARDKTAIPSLAADVPQLELPYLIDNYLLVRELGRGGMGVVFQARQESLGRDVAIKMLLSGRWANRDDQARIRAEAAAAAQLDHPHIVPVYEVGQHEGNTYFSMKYIVGQTLAARLQRGPLDRRSAARLLEKVARAVDYAHRRGILHRDLKPSNILLDEDDEPHVSDFGLAKSVTQTSNLTRSGAVVGTPAYMSPEQAAGHRLQMGPRSDIYSLGCILYHMLTGQPPHQAEHPVDVVLQVLEQQPTPPRDVDPRIDRDLEMITLRCLQKPQDLRYRTADDLANDLHAFLHDEPVSARSGRFGQIIARLFRETHHAPILENWGLLWIWHSLALLTICLLTHLLHHHNVRYPAEANRFPYFLLWTAGLGTWAAVFWALRRRMGPVTFVERHIAHTWAASMISSALLFPIEYLLHLPVLTLSPVLGVASGAVFLVKAAILTGTFYIQATLLFATALVMARWPNVAHLVFGFVAGLCFFVPGWKYWQQRKTNEANRALP